MRFQGLDLLRTSLLTALGAAPLACGGSVVADAGTGGSGSSQGGTKSSQGGAPSASGSAGLGGGFAGAGGAAPANAFACANPTPLLGGASGYEQCQDGSLRRLHAAECPSQLPRPTPIADYDPVTDDCRYDSDCVAEPHGYCGISPVHFGPVGGRYCNYGCRVDADCGADAVCLCDDPIGRCVQAKCVSFADCQPGFDCRSYEPQPGCPGIGFACQSPLDTCAVHADCSGGMQCFQADTVRTCLGVSCEVGRPFLVHGLARTARAAERSDWLEADLEPSVVDLEPHLRARLAKAWTRAGRMEHASIAAFARFGLQLLSLGAPASLIEQATRAMADETLHAKRCFAVASRYAGKPVGPGRLSVEGSLDPATFSEIVITALREGCVGETVAAVEAAEASRHAGDPALREVLAAISADETRHAELAWLFVKWALAQGGRELRDAVAREVAELSAESAAEIPLSLSASEDDLVEHGVLPESLRRALRAEVLTRVVAPCAAALALESPCKRGDLSAVPPLCLT